MPNIDIIRSAIAELPKASPLVVALPGGTTGIGSYIAKALATTFASHGSKLRVYIIGRSAARAEAVIKEGQKISPGSDWRLILTTDLALISEVDRCCADIIRQETEAPFHGGPTRLDLLYMTYSYPLLKEQSSTYRIRSNEGPVRDHFILTHVMQPRRRDWTHSCRHSITLEFGS